ncbi:hypothetical protein DPMN_012338 [Dreissena polymorpha]|uniref:Uncharacterized protein n=1 Tax=Dreissena polymorpha TaxID=45954 RepID=A0A9D4N5C2_DREPO|nr:hypothetical protein DPMN_012338 [Dreissena polymorpha]
MRNSYSKDDHKTKSCNREDDQRPRSSSYIDDHLQRTFKPLTTTSETTASHLRGPRHREDYPLDAQVQPVCRSAIVISTFLWNSVENIMEFYGNRWKSMEFDGIPSTCQFSI